SQGILNGLEECFKQNNIRLTNVKNIVHGTTLITNSIIERKGSKTGLITTKGFKDILDIGRELRYDLYDLFMLKPQQLVSNDNILELDTRDIESVDYKLKKEIFECIKEFKKNNIKSIAISLIHDEYSSKIEQEIKSII